MWLNAYIQYFADNVWSIFLIGKMSYNTLVIKLVSSYILRRSNLFCILHIMPMPVCIQKRWLQTWYALCFLVNPHQQENLYKPMKKTSRNPIPCQFSLPCWQCHKKLLRPVLLSKFVYVKTNVSGIWFPYLMSDWLPGQPRPIRGHVRKHF